MQRQLAFKFQLRPDGQQQRLMRRFAGYCRFVFNSALALQRRRYEGGNKRLCNAELCALLPDWKRERPWLSEAPSQALQQSLMNLERAYRNFFDQRAAFPRFKLDQTNGRIFLPKLGWMRLWLSRSVVGELRNATVSFSGGRWHVSIQTP
jgi:putative transposase